VTIPLTPATGIDRARRGTRAVTFRWHQALRPRRGASPSASRLAVVPAGGRRQWIIALLSLATLACDAGAEPVFHKGMTLAHGYRPHNNLRSDEAAAAMRHLREEVHVEWIALTPFAYQRRADDVALHFGDDPPDDHLVHAIDRAHALGLRVLLKPHIWLRERTDSTWRGTIGMGSDEEWQRWFANYERFLLHYARLAQRADVDLLCVGVELARTMKEREDDWRALIGRVREVYDGPLTYAANWWGEYDEIGIWDAVDYVGVNAFFPLSSDADPGLDSLLVGAQRVADRIEAVHRATGRPVLFTEVGFKSTLGSTVTPWTWTRRYEPAVDVDLQARAYRAVLEVFWARPWFHGMYWWKWYSHADHGGPRNGDFTPRGKPAESVLSEWFRQMPTPSR
jgi:hypothetical protein